MTTTHPHLTPEQIEQLGQELDELRNRVAADLGQRDVDYIHNVIKAQRGLEIAGRALLLAGFLPPAWLAGTTALSLSKILDNMEISLAGKRDILQQIWKKGRRQVLKDYVAFPLLAGPFAPFVLSGNLTANVVRNVWSYMIIFCGHFPEGVEEFAEEEVENETRGGWYLRQMLGSANLTGGKLFHILSGNLSRQIEHHLFPDIPAHRYAEIAVDVREICARYGLPYNTGPLSRQFGSVVKKIVRLALPSRD